MKIHLHNGSPHQISVCGYRDLAKKALTADATKATCQRCHYLVGQNKERKERLRQQAQAEVEIMKAAAQTNRFAPSRIVLRPDGAMVFDSMEDAFRAQDALTQRTKNPEWETEVSGLLRKVEALEADKVRLTKFVRDLRIALEHEQRKNLASEKQEKTQSLAGLCITLGSGGRLSEELAEVRASHGMSAKEAAHTLQIPVSIYLGLEHRELTVSSQQWQRLIAGLRVLSVEDVKDHAPAQKVRICDYGRLQQKLASIEHALEFLAMLHSRRIVRRPDVVSDICGGDKVQPSIMSTMITASALEEGVTLFKKRRTAGNFLVYEATSDLDAAMDAWTTPQPMQRAATNVLA